MKRIITILMVLLLLGIAGCGGDDAPAADIGAPDTEGSAESDAPVAAATADKEESISGSIKDLVARAVPMKCTWSFSSEGMDSSGTAYVNGDKYSTQVSADGETFNFISDGDYMYIWNTIQPGGTKMSIEAMEEMGADTEQGEVDAGELNMQTLDADYNYKCTPWVVSNSKFVPPSDVEFKDFTEMMQQMQEMAENFDACSMCDMLPDSEQAECLANC